MKRILPVLIAAGLVLAPAAAAKGPHAILTTPREPVVPGKPWEVTVELNEFRHPPAPAMIATRHGRTVGARVEKTPASIPGAAGFKFSVVFPTDGAWRLTLFAGKRRFAFPRVRVGGARMPQDYVAFPVGSEAARAGANGIWTTDEAPAGGGDALPPERIDYEDVAAADDGGEGGGFGAWVLPLLGVALAGAGVAAVTRRGWR